ncbi:Cytoplasmic tRNA 2-thiolation protein 2 [Chytriomyces hyalinus]|nr:Cytoplasmic tRNA 2-thiolation protein 2 [Chytriomyces hyalinus]
MNTFLNKTLKNNTAARFSSVVVCVVDYSCLLSKSRESIESEMKEMQTVVESFGFTFKRVPLESVFANENGDLGLHLVADGADEQIRLLQHRGEAPQGATPLSHTLSLFESLRTTPASNATTAVSLLSTLVKRLLIRTALANNCTSLIMGPNASTIAGSIVTATALGGGFNLPNDISLEYKVPGANLVIFRPIRDLLWIEVEKIVQVDSVQIFHAVAHMADGLFGSLVAAPGADHNNMNVSKMTIQDLAKSFVSGLQRDFPQSVSTVTRTAFKIETGSSVAGLQTCLLCSSPIQPNSQKWRKSHTVSALSEVVLPEDPVKPVTQSGTTSCETPNAHIADDLLCYSCQHVSRDVSNRKAFVVPGEPWFLGVKASLFSECVDENSAKCCGNESACAGGRNHPGRVENLREQIQDFLLEDDDE